jgi:hypothetical protein
VRYSVTTIVFANRSAPEWISVARGVDLGGTSLVRAGICIVPRRAWRFDVANGGSTRAGFRALRPYQGGGRKDGRRNSNDALPATD